MSRRFISLYYGNIRSIAKQNGKGVTENKSEKQLISMLERIQRISMLHFTWLCVVLFFSPLIKKLFLQ